MNIEHMPKMGRSLAAGLFLYALLPFAGSSAGLVIQKEEDAIRNPFARDPGAIEAGRKSFLSRCAFCHGTDARGSGRGSNLTTGRWTHGGRDSEIFNAIRKGVPGTEMSSHNLPDDETWQLVAFIRSAGNTGEQPPVAGDPEIGKAIFFGKGRCSSCHMLGGDGSPLGPDLSNIGAERSSSAIRRAILEPDAEIGPGFLGAQLQLRTGERIEGLIKNEDNFSLQLMDLEGRFRLLDKKQVSVLTRLKKKSLMPAGIARDLTPGQLQDLLAFLDRQRPANNNKLKEATAPKNNGELQRN